MSHFNDQKLAEEANKKLDNNNDSKEIFEEHAFVAMCLLANITIDNLRTITYVDVMKILLSSIPDKEHENKSRTRKATQEDMDRMR